MKLHQKLLYSDNFSTVLSQKAIKLLLRLCEKFHEVHINILFNIYNTTKLDLSMTRRYDMIYDTRCYFNVCSKADISQTEPKTKKWKKRKKLNSKKGYAQKYQ